MTDQVHNRFDEIKHTPLKVFNRVVTLSNINQDFGKTSAEEYIKQFSDNERVQMFILIAAIKEKGIEAIQKEVTKDMPLEEETQYVH